MSHDVYLSFDADDSAAVEPFARALSAAGLDVVHGGHDDEVTADLLHSSKVLFAYYSANYPRTTRCQWELASIARTSPTRCVAVNPEGDREHIAPREGLHLLASAYPATEHDIRAVAGKVDELVRAFPDAAGTARLPPSWRDRPVNFTGRFTELWRLHELLTAPGSNTVVVHGPPNSGKSTLVAQYAALFGASFPGGCHWLGPFRGADSVTWHEFAALYRGELRDVAAGPLGVDPAGAAPDLIPSIVARELVHESEKALLIVDDAVFSPGIGRLLVQSRGVRTVLTTRDEPTESAFPRLRLAALSTVDSNAGGSTHRLLVAAALLAPSPIPLSLLTGVADEAVLEDLASHGLVRREPDGWVFRPSVCAAAFEEARADEVADLGRQLAMGLLRKLEPTGAHPGHPTSHLRRHAVTLADRQSVPTSLRLDLLRSAAAAHHAAGDLSLATRALTSLLALRPDDPDDLLTAARVGIDHGAYRHALVHAVRAVELAGCEDDEGTLVRAGVLAAHASDLLGEYETADEVFWASAVAAGIVQAPKPSHPDAWQVVLALGAALRLRGRPADARSLHLATKDRWGHPDTAEHTRNLVIELARTELSAGNFAEAGRLAAAAVAELRASGLGNAPQTLAALGLHAESVLAAGGSPSVGEPDVVALAGAVRRARQLAGSHRPRTVLGIIAETDDAVVTALGAHHPLRLRARYALGLAHSRLRNYECSRVIFADLLPRQIALLGRGHPETLETRLSLGIAMAVTGELDRGRAVVAEAARELRLTPADARPARRRAVLVGWLVGALPRAALGTAALVDRRLSATKP